MSQHGPAPAQSPAPVQPIHPSMEHLSPCTAWASWRAAGHWMGLGSGPEAKTSPISGCTSHEGPAISLPQAVTTPAFTSGETEARSDSTLRQPCAEPVPEQGPGASPAGINQARGTHRSWESPGTAPALGVQGRGLHLQQVRPFSGLQGPRPARRNAMDGTRHASLERQDDAGEPHHLCKETWEALGQCQEQLGDAEKGAQGGVGLGQKEGQGKDCRSCVL